ncbi:MAG: Ig-like domain repeat protein, partial [Bifidobacteriaceae bacterium]|nr:Ig-like domain repeat protein [Bifidobacteriaceae bacterium]
SAPASGTVTFYDGTTEVGSASIVRGALTSASLDIGPLAAGSHAISASYAGDSRYLAGQSQAVTVQVARPVVVPEPEPVVTPEPEPLTISLVAIPTTVNLGEAVSLVSVVSRVVPGKVTFWEGSAQVAEAALEGPAALGSVKNLAVGSHAIVARFAPTDGSAATTSRSVAVDVLPAPAPEDTKVDIADTKASVARLAVTSVRVVKGATVKVPLMLDSAQSVDAGKALTVSWKASKPSVATPVKGKASGTFTASLNSAKALTIRGAKVGTSTIRVTAPGAKAVTVKVTVVAKKVAASKVTLTSPPKTLAVGASRVLAVKATPSRATSAVPVWKSSKPAVASVDATGKVIAKQKGTTKITVTIAGKKAAFTLKVA